MLRAYSVPLIYIDFSLVKKIIFFQRKSCAFNLLEAKYWLLHSLWSKNIKSLPFKVTCGILNY